MKVGSITGTIKNVFFLALLFFGIMGHAAGQSNTEAVNYEILVLGIKIGNITAQKVAAGDSLRYVVDSQVKFWFFGDVDLKLLTRSHFSGGKIVKTYSDSKTNRGNFLSKVTWKGSQYAVDAKTYKYANATPLKGPLSWCSTKMFFQEPSGQELFLSEVYGVAAPIKKIGPGTYEVKVEGNTNRYYYEGGRLAKIVVENTIKDYQVRRVK
jgi:hypothetical protein